MKNISRQFKHVLAIIFLSISFSAMSSELPDPEVLAKQYLKDLCTLNEQDFTHKYTLTQEEMDFFINEMTASFKRMNKMDIGKISDTTEIKSFLQELVLRSYKEFKEWQHENQIDSSKIIYYACEFKLEKEREISFYKTGIVKIYFKIDSMNYAITCDDFVFLKNKWVGGKFYRIQLLDKYFNEMNGDYDYAADTAVVIDYIEGTELGEGSNELTMEATKRRLKIQKKLDACNRKIDALIDKQVKLIGKF